MLVPANMRVFNLTKVTNTKGIREIITCSLGDNALLQRLAAHVLHDTRNAKHRDNDIHVNRTHT